MSSASPASCIALGALLVGLQAHAELPWRSIRGAGLPATFIGHEMADGAHYAYHFRADGTFTGVDMGKEVRGTWRSTATEFCWTQRTSRLPEECFDVETQGDKVRLLRDGYPAFSARLSPSKSGANKDSRR